MNVCNLAEMKQHIINCGYLLTNNVFFVEDNLHWEFLVEKQYIKQYTGNIVENRLVQSSVYFVWNYKTGVRHYEDYDTFRVQLTLFKFFKDSHVDYVDTLMQELLDYDLCEIAIRSEHLF